MDGHILPLVLVVSVYWSLRGKTPLLRAPVTILPLLQWTETFLTLGGEVASAR